MVSYLLDINNYLGLHNETIGKRLPDKVHTPAYLTETEQDAEDYFKYSYKKTTTKHLEICRTVSKTEILGLFLLCYAPREEQIVCCHASRTFLGDFLSDLQTFSPPKVGYLFKTWSHSLTF